MNEFKIETKKALFIGEVRITEFVYDDAFTMGNLAVMVKKECEKYILKFISLEGKEIKILSNVYSYQNHHTCIITQFADNFYCVLSQNGDEIFSGQFDKIFYRDGILCVRKNGKYGAYNLDGNLIIPIEYNDIIFFKNIIRVTNGEYIGIYNYEGKVIVPCRYIQVNACNKGVIVGNKQCLYGFYSYDGNLIIPVEFESLQELYCNFVVASKAGLIGLYNYNTCEKILDTVYFDYVIDRDLLLIKNDKEVRKYNILSGEEIH